MKGSWRDDDDVGQSRDETVRWSGLRSRCPIGPPMPKVSATPCLGLLTTINCASTSTQMLLRLGLRSIEGQICLGCGRNSSDDPLRCRDDKTGDERGMASRLASTHIKPVALTSCFIQV